MKPVFQTRRGKEGNCWAAGLASILELPIEDVDHCAGNHPDWLKQTEDFLAHRGLFYVEIPKGADGNFPNTVLPDGAYVLLGCNTERNLPHIVVGQCHHTEFNEQGAATKYELWIVHDPIKPGGPSGEYKVDSLILLCRFDR